ncbi:hypothetical protein Celaphus_00019018 [Cervus elaphus hippelaphus]|uniref:C2H2-type domain-containing protein n=1 Tax=Cervus elaphus hippelaphus TaxID=46360 RepID=A0A212C7S4_CEREH|nr:hypothetical protein Celaphus_00019018 [Cervus elaphus hippelaphus]
MNEYPKKRKRKTVHPSRYSDSSGISKIADGLNGIFSDHCYKESPVKVHTAEDVPVATEVHAISEDWDIETGNHSSESLQVHQLVADEELPAKLCRIADKSQALNVNAQQKWPLLRASNSSLYKCELCEFNRKYSDLKQAYDLEAQVYWFKPSALQTPILVITFIGVSNMTYSSPQVVNSTYISRSSCGEQYLCQYCEREMSDPEDLHSHVGNEHACKLIELSGKYNNGESGQHSLLSKITFDKCKNFGVDFIQMVTDMLLLNTVKFSPMFVMTVGKASQVCWNIANIYLKGFIYVNTVNIQQDRLKILKFI